MTPHDGPAATGSAGSEQRVGPLSGDDVVDAAALAERALVGSLVWHPPRVHTVASWLRSDDFASPVDARLYEVVTAMVELGRSDRLVFELPDALARGLYRSLPGPEPRLPIATWALRVHERLRADPSPSPSASPSAFATPGVAPIHVRYGRIVLEASVRRVVSEVGTVTGRVVGLADADARDVAGVATSSMRRLGDLAERTATAGLDRAPPRPEPTTTAREATMEPDPAVLAGLATERQLRRAELDVVAGALTIPSFRADSLARLEASDFAHSTIAATWAAIADLHHHGEPVDYVLVAHRAERTRETAGEPIAADQLAKIGTMAPRPVDAYRGADLISRAALIRAAARCAPDSRRANGITVASAPDVLESAQRHHATVLDRASQVDPPDIPPPRQQGTPSAAPNSPSVSRGRSR